LESYILAIYFLSFDQSTRCLNYVLFVITVMAHTNISLLKPLSLCMTLAVDELGCIR
jgi:hypothetical protein